MSDLRELCRKTWNKMYPDRRPWDQISASTQEDWIRVFGIFEYHLRQEPFINDDLAKELDVDFDTLLETVAEMHVIFCPDKKGTWKERVAQLKEAVHEYQSKV